MVMLTSPEGELATYNILTGMLPRVFEQFEESEECVGYLEYRPAQLGNTIATLFTMFMTGGPGIGTRHAWLWRHPGSDQLVVRTCDVGEMIPNAEVRFVYDFLPGTRDYHFHPEDFYGALVCALTWLLQYQRRAIPDFIVEYRNFFDTEEDARYLAERFNQPLPSFIPRHPTGPDLIGTPE